MRMVSVTRPTDGQRMTLALESRPFAGVGSFISEWEESAQRAMAAEPLYFYNWDKVKTTLLVIVSGALVWQLLK